MDDKSQKERLEQELRFLKESFEAEVISREEYEKGKDRIEKKLKEIQGGESEIQGTDEKKHDEENSLTDDIVAAREEEKIKLKVFNDEDTGKGQEQIQKIENKEIFQESKAEAEKQKYESRFFRYAVVFVVLAIVIFFSYSLLKSNREAQKAGDVKFAAACSSDEDCRQEGKEGACLEPGAKNAKCEFKNIEKTNVIVLNDRNNCFNCDTQRVLNILESWFGPINFNEIDYNTLEGKSIAEKFNANVLPAYILDGNITKKPAFGQFKQAFSKKDNFYLLNEDAAGSAFYFKRDNIPKKLDLFVIAGDSASIKSENNLKEFLDNFKDVKFEKHLSNEPLIKDIGIKTFPTFLVNNRVKFSGILTSDAIKNNFCSLNKLKECEKILSRNLV